MNSQKPGKNINNNNILEKNAKQGRRSRSMMAIFLIVIVGITVLCFAIMGMISYFEGIQEESKGNTILFYEPDYDADIMQNAEYLGLNRSIMFENTETGITIEIVDNDLYDVPSTFRDSVSLLIDYVNYAINGKTDDLNSLFSDEYVEAGGKVKMDFTMQQLYNIKISYVTSLATTDADGSTYQSHDYWLEYMIHKNNGTFRSDMGSDCIRKEYVRVTDRDGSLGIDVLAPYVTQEREPQQTLTGGKITALITVSAIIIVIFGVICWLVSKPRKRKY